jgi:ADP-ribose pyrophosphatase
MHTLHETKHLLIKEHDGWDYVERKKGKTAVAVIAETEDGKVILTEQFRRAVNARVIDWPAGLVGDEDEQADAAETAKKELEEETGFVCARVERLAEGPTSPGITSERVALYRAVDVRRVGEGGGVGGESITVHTVLRGVLVEWLKKKEREGVLIDLKVWGGLFFLT